MFLSQVFLATLCVCVLSAPVEQTSTSKPSSTPKSTEHHTVEVISPIGDHITHVAHIPVILAPHQIPTHFIISDTGDASSKSPADKTTSAPSTTEKIASSTAKAAITAKSEENHKNIKRDVVVGTNKPKVEDKKTESNPKVATTTTETTKDVKTENKSEKPSKTTTVSVKESVSADLPNEHLSKSDSAKVTKEADKSQVTKHDQHKREATTVKEDSKKSTSGSIQLSNPTIATPSILLKSEKKVADQVDTKKVDSKPIPTEKPAHDSTSSQLKHPKRETTKGAETKPEPAPANAEPTKDFHTSHRIPEHIQSHLRNDEGKFQTSHHIPTHSAPVVVGVTPKKPADAVVAKSDAISTTESAKKEQTKEEVKNTKPSTGSRHRRDTATTVKPDSSTKSGDHLVRVPLTKSKPVEVTKPQQQNGHAAHSDADARIKRESKASTAVDSKKVPEEHHSSLVFPVPVDQIVKHSEAAPEIHQ